MAERTDRPAEVRDGRCPPWVLRDYAVLADGERGAVVDPEGRIVWLCAPRRHSDAVFSALIGGAGYFGCRTGGRMACAGRPLRGRHADPGEPLADRRRRDRVPRRAGDARFGGPSRTAAPAAGREGRGPAAAHSRSEAGLRSRPGPGSPAGG
ncbi:trehalase-like domain-containing protein [Streptomyces sp. NPDC047000]|uniref:trehalase-like domain-containing protein n=1 Tax=Streptomyces sp. NPDC047000 TaxID=3155474 RepID=UPI0034011743